MKRDYTDYFGQIDRNGRYPILRGCYYISGEDVSLSSMKFVFRDYWNFKKLEILRIYFLICNFLVLNYNHVYICVTSCSVTSIQSTSSVR